MSEAVAVASEPQGDGAHRGKPHVRLALYQPDIPQNTGSMLRMAACLGLGVELIEPAGFPVSDRAFRRAGLDYLDCVEIDRHLAWPQFLARTRHLGRRPVLLTTRASRTHASFAFTAGDVLIVGRESAGVPQSVHEAVVDHVRVPMRAGLRSLNVAMAAAIVCGEALRQTGLWPHDQTEHNTA